MATRAPAKAQTLSRVIEELRRMIVSGELLPGQQIRQESMAERLGVSRLPIREALRQLTADGLVRHIPNVGYMVTRLSRAEFDEIYFMRKVVETELIMTLPKPTAKQLAEIIALNDLVIDDSEREDLAAMQHHNHDFHFTIFHLSDMKLVIGEIERLWTWASPYHAVYLFSPDTRRHVLDEHATMIEALRQGDNELLARTMDLHRHGSETQIGGILGMTAGAVPVP